MQIDTDIPVPPKRRRGAPPKYRLGDIPFLGLGVLYENTTEKAIKMAVKRHCAHSSGEFEWIAFGPHVRVWRVL